MYTQEGHNPVFLVSLLLTLNSFHTTFIISIVDFEQVDICFIFVL